MNEKLSRVMVLVAVMLTVMTVVALALVASGLPEDGSPILKKEELTVENMNNTTNSSNKNKNIKYYIQRARKLQENIRRTGHEV